MVITQRRSAEKSQRKVAWDLKLHVTTAHKGTDESTSKTCSAADHGNRQDGHGHSMQHAGRGKVRKEARKLDARVHERNAERIINASLRRSLA